MSRKRNKARSAEMKARIVALVKEGPKSSREITSAIGGSGSALGVYFSELVREGIVSRYEYRKGMFRYYPGQTAPAGSFRDERKQLPKPEKRSREYAFPVKQVSTWVGDRFNRVTLPAAPWEVAI